MTFLFTFSIAMPGLYKRGILIVADSLILIFALWLSFSLRMDVWYWPNGGVNNSIVMLVLFAPVVAVPVFMQFGLYRAIVRYLGMKAFFSVFKAVMIYAAFWGFLVFLTNVQGVPRSVVPINAMVALFLIGGSRFFARWLLRKIEVRDQAKKHHFNHDMGFIEHRQAKVVIFGAGEAGKQVCNLIQKKNKNGVFCFVDDNKKLIDKNYNGVKIISKKKLKQISKEHLIPNIIIAIPSLENDRLVKLSDEMYNYSASVYNLPSKYEYNTDHILLSNIKN